MPRHPRLFLPGAVYHAYCRVARGEFVVDGVEKAADEAPPWRARVDFGNILASHVLEAVTLNSSFVFEDPSIDPRRYP
jgi:hypothetical protein